MSKWKQWVVSIFEPAPHLVKIGHMLFDPRRIVSVHAGGGDAVDKSIITYGQAGAASGYDGALRSLTVDVPIDKVRLILAPWTR